MRVWVSYITELVFVVTMLRIKFMADFWGSMLRDYFYRHLPISVVSEPDPRKIGRRVWEIGWGRSVPSRMYGICNY